MGRSRYKIFEQNTPHFLTCTVINWAPIFTRPETVQIILEAFNYRQQHRDFKLYGYVILENHLHCIAQCADLSKEMQSFKSYTAKLLIQYFEERQVTRILQQFAFYKKAHKVDREYQVWEEGSHPQFIYNEEMLLQKLTYIHENPVKRGYVDDPVHWRNSSARNYAGMTGLIPVFTEWWTG